MSGAGDHRHAPGLDGIRGAAVAAITAYHLGWIDGGILSLSVFFALSGYLITSILLASLRKTGRIDLRTFWLRRARRLLPGLALLLVVVLGAAAIARPRQLGAYARQALSASLYVANWATIARGDDYFNRFSGPGPFDHLWSLAIEEQFYVLWPLLLVGLLIVSGRRGAKGEALGRRALIPTMVVTGLLAAASAVAMAWLYAPEAINNTRAYEGTDARAAPILLGSLAAMLLPLGEIGHGGRRRRVVLDVIGLISLVIVVVAVAVIHEDSPYLYRGGETLVALASLGLVLAAGHPSTLTGKALGIAPLRWLGVRTYGVYLWHMPVVAFVPASALASHPIARGALQVGLIVGLAALSWSLVEDPIRRDGVIAPFFRDAGPKVAQRWASVTALVPFATVALIAWPLSSPASADPMADFEALVEESASAPPPQPIELASPFASASPSASASAEPPKGALLTRCTQLVHVGDSTSLALIAKSYIPAPEDRLVGRYQSVGVKTFVQEISGGRSIVEKFNGKPSAWEVVAARSGGGYEGCWVFAVGIADTATIYGNVPALSKRIGWMMDRAEGRPVLWTTYKTLLEKGRYQNAYMERWNEAVIAACARYPNMRVYDWASEVQDEWYLPDGIHPNDPGAKARAAGFAHALAIAFPKDGPSPPGCLVRSTP